LAGIELISPTLDLQQIQMRAIQTLEKGVQIDLSTAMCKKYLRRHANQKTNVVVLYVDIDGSTQMTLSVKSADLAHILQLFSQEMSIVVANYGGYVLKYVGDAVIALFPAEHDMKKANSQALECGRMMLEVINKCINPALSSKGLPELRVKISLDFGDILIILYGKSLENAHIDVVGSCVSMAAKMLAIVPSGRIIMGQSVRDSLPESISKSLVQFDVDESMWSYMDQNKKRYRLYLTLPF